MYSLRQRMVRSFLGLALIPLLISALLLGWYSLYNQSNHTYRFEKLHATQLAGEISEIFRDAEILLRTITKFQNFVALPEAHQQELLTELLFEDMILESITLISTTNDHPPIEVARRHFSAHKSSIQWEQLPYVKRALVTGELNYGHVEIDPDTAEPHIYLALPLIDLRTGTKETLLIARLQLSSLRTLLSDRRHSDSENLYLTDNDGHIIAHHDTSVVLRGEHYNPVSSEYPQRDLEQNYAIIVSVPFRVSNLTLHLIAEQLAMDAFRTTLISFQLFAMVMLLALLAAVSMLKLSIRTIVMPIEQVTQAARIIRDGDINHQVQLTSSDELGTLAEAFNSMTKRLNLSLQELQDENRERRQVESELQQSHAEQEQLLISLDGMVKERTQELQEKLIELERAQEGLIQSEKMASIGRLVSGFAHELNTPIGIAVGASSLMEESATKLSLLIQQDEVTEDELRQVIHAIQESSLLTVRNLDRASKLIGRLKRFSLDQHNETPRRYSPCNILDDLIKTHHSQFVNTHIQIDLQCRAEIELYGDPGPLDLILSNLLMNSLEHGFAQGSTAGAITIKAEVTEQKLHIDYSDNGSGISQQAQNQIFDPFFTTTGWGKSSGLGLFICYTLVTAKLHGTIRCQSTPNSGTHFIIDYPVQIEQPESST